MVDAHGTTPCRRAHPRSAIAPVDVSAPGNASSRWCVRGESSPGPSQPGGDGLRHRGGIRGCCSGSAGPPQCERDGHVHPGGSAGDAHDCGGGAEFGYGVRPGKGWDTLVGSLGFPDFSMGPSAGGGGGARVLEFRRALKEVLPVAPAFVPRSWLDVDARAVTLSALMQGFTRHSLAL